MVRHLAKGRRGFTLIELLVVVLILAILMAVALPLYLSAVKDSERRTCRSNMQTIANAVQAARVKARASDYSTWIGAPVNSTNEPDLQATPVCPDSGTYSIAADASGGSAFTVHCTIPEHDAGSGTEGAGFTPGVNSQ